MTIAREIWEEAAEYGIAKWHRGQAKHGGTLTLKPTLPEAIDEAVDQIAYLFVLRRQVEDVKQLLAVALETGNPEFIRRAMNVLEYGNREGAPA